MGKDSSLEPIANGLVTLRLALRASVDDRQGCAPVVQSGLALNKAAASLSSRLLLLAQLLLEPSPICVQVEKACVRVVTLAFELVCLL